MIHSQNISGTSSLLSTTLFEWQGSPEKKERQYTGYVDGIYKVCGELVPDPHDQRNDHNNKQSETTGQSKNQSKNTIVDVLLLASILSHKSSQTIE